MHLNSASLNTVFNKEIADMDKIELLELINKGESSFAEFKADTPDIKAETIASMSYALQIQRAEKFC